MGAAGTVVSAAPASPPEGRQPAAIGPWRLACRRLRRNKVALAFLALLLMIVVLCLLAPVYSQHVAHIGPNTNNVTGTVNVNGMQQDIVSARRGADRAHVRRPLLLRR